MSRNPDTCPHNVTNVDDDEWYCLDCGEVLGTLADYYAKYGEPDF